jgi:hypothetical protein
MAIEAVAAIAAKEVAVEAAKEAALQSAREIAQKMAAEAGTQSTGSELQNAMMERQAMQEGFRVGEMPETKGERRELAKQREVDAAEELRGKLDAEETRPEAADSPETTEEANPEAQKPADAAEAAKTQEVAETVERPRQTWSDFRDPESASGKPVYQLECGRDSELLNGRLPEKSILELDNPEGKNHIRVETNGHGRVIEIKADKLERIDGVRDLNQQRKCCLLKDGKSGDDAGHGIAREFGAPREQFNLFPMNKEVNRFMSCKDSGMTTYRFMEGKIEKAMDSGHGISEYRIRTTYNDDSFRPTSFNVAYRVDGRPTYFHIKNPVLAA